MTQPAKVQEPSMEEILASIRRIIADDEAKPPLAEKPAGAAAPAKPEKAGRSGTGSEGARHERYSSVSRCRRATPAAAKAPPPVIAPAPPPVASAAASNSQDDIDAMLAGLDEATSEAEIRPPQPDGEVFELTDEMALPDPPPVRIPQDRSGGRSGIYRGRGGPGGAPAARVRTAAF